MSTSTSSQGQTLSPPAPHPASSIASAQPNSGTTALNLPVVPPTRFPVIYLTIEKRNSSPRVYNIPIGSVDTWDKFLQTLLHICPAEARALLISSDGPGGNKSYIIPSTWGNCLVPGREFLLQLGSCIKDPECPVCFRLNSSSLLSSNTVKVPIQSHHNQQHHQGETRKSDSGSGDRDRESVVATMGAVGEKKQTVSKGEIEVGKR